MNAQISLNTHTRGRTIAKRSHQSPVQSPASHSHNQFFPQSVIISFSFRTQATIPVYRTTAAHLSVRIRSIFLFVACALVLLIGEKQAHCVSPHLLCARRCIDNRKSIFRPEFHFVIVTPFEIDWRNWNESKLINKLIASTVFPTTTTTTIAAAAVYQHFHLVSNDSSLFPFLRCIFCVNNCSDFLCVVSTILDGKLNRTAEKWVFLGIITDKKFREMFYRPNNMRWHIQFRCIDVDERQTADGKWEMFAPQQSWTPIFYCDAAEVFILHWTYITIWRVFFCIKNAKIQQISGCIFSERLLYKFSINC